LTQAKRLCRFAEAREWAAASCIEILTRRDIDAREREVTDAEWTEFDLDAGVWKISTARTKKNRAHLVHLAPQAIAILESLKPIIGRKRHVFASPLKKISRSADAASTTRP